MSISRKCKRRLSILSQRGDFASLTKRRRRLRRAFGYDRASILRDVVDGGLAASPDDSFQWLERSKRRARFNPVRILRIRRLVSKGQTFLAVNAVMLLTVNFCGRLRCACPTNVSWKLFSLFSQSPGTTNSNRSSNIRKVVLGPRCYMLLPGYEFRCGPGRRSRPDRPAFLISDAANVALRSSAATELHRCLTARRSAAAFNFIGLAKRIARRCVRLDRPLGIGFGAEANITKGNAQNKNLSVSWLRNVCVNSPIHCSLMTPLCGHIDRFLA